MKKNKQKKPVKPSTPALKAKPVKKVKKPVKTEDPIETQVQKDKDQENHIVINKKASKKAKWYVVHTYSGHEQKVAAGLTQRTKSMNLTEHILEILIPTQNKIQIRKGQKYSVKEKLFPGYMLVKLILSDDSWLAVRTTQGVTGFVGVGNKPTPLPKSEVQNIMKFMKMEAPKYKATFSVGEAVKIIEGPFADFLGSVESIDNERGKVKVLVSIFGRETPVELDFLQVSKI